MDDRSFGAVVGGKVRIAEDAGNRSGVDDGAAVGRQVRELGAFLPGERLPGLSVAGAADGVWELAGCLRSGNASAGLALSTIGVEGCDDHLPTVAPVPARTPSAVPWYVPNPADEQGLLQFVDMQRDATVADIRHAVAAGMRSLEHVKRYTPIGTAHDQGKTSGIVASHAANKRAAGWQTLADGLRSGSPPWWFTGSDPEALARVYAARAAATCPFQRSLQRPGNET